MAAGDMESRVTKLETEMVDVKADLSEIKAQIGQAATKKDLGELRSFFVERDQSYTKNLWKLVFGLVALVALIAAGAVGLTAGDVGALFGR